MEEEQDKKPTEDTEEEEDQKPAAVQRVEPNEIAQLGQGGSDSFSSRGHSASKRREKWSTSNSEGYHLSSEWCGVRCYQR